MELRPGSLVTCPTHLEMDGEYRKAWRAARLQQEQRRCVCHTYIDDKDRVSKAPYDEYEYAVKPP